MSSKDRLDPKNPIFYKTYNPNFEPWKTLEETYAYVLHKQLTTIFGKEKKI